jgi:hypothetical protein
MSYAKIAQNSFGNLGTPTGYYADRSRGFEPWGITNPWVWADYTQPQRLRGHPGPSPLVYKTQGPYLLSSLGQATGESASEARGRRMELMSLVGLAISVTSFVIMHQGRPKAVRSNRRQRRSGGKK